ncbi:MAG: ribosomal protein L6 [Cenarchaeum symbiont of Oopsacas minuta]|nr:ribosomal protein L6 [Cenarchaeum symbiont of Oopsacas minuta]
MSSNTQYQKKSQDVLIPDGVSVNIKGRMMHVKGPLGETFKNFKKIPVDIEIGEKSVTVKSRGTRKRDYSIMNTARSLVRVLFEGIVTGYTIKMKIVYAHFPVTVSVKNNTVHIENFQGERSARLASIVGKTKIVPKGDNITITGAVLTDVTQTAANIAQKTKVKNKDHRVFLDGIYIEEKSSGIEK